MTLVSVLVSAYRPTYLVQALESALRQRHHELEIVVVDDSDGPEVGEIVRGLGDPRMRYLRNDRNLGPALSHARAITAATAPVLGILNDDDVWEPSLVSRLLEALESAPQAVVAFADHWVIVDGRRDEGASEECTRRWKRDVLEPGLHAPFQRLALVHKSIPLAVAALFRRGPVERESVPAAVGGSYDFFLSYLLCRGGEAAVYVPERLASWRVHAANLTRDPSCVRAEEGVAVTRILMDDRRLAMVRPELRRVHAEALWSVATRNLRSGSRIRAAHAGLEALRHGRLEAALLVPGVLVPRRLLPPPAV